MRSQNISRRDLVVALAAMPSGLGVAAGALPAADTPAAVNAAVPQEISRTALAIHQEIVFPASRTRVYHAGEGFGSGKPVSA